MMKGDTVIVDRGAIGRRRKMTTDPTNGECNKSKPFNKADGEPLDVTAGNGECEDLLAFNGQINVHHVGGKLVGGSLLGAVLTLELLISIYVLFPDALPIPTAHHNKAGSVSAMESISRLREALLRVLSGRVTLEIEQECFDELMIQKSRLLNVLDVGQSNPEEKREVESGK